MSDTHDAALEVIRRITRTPDPSLWPLGTWLQQDERPGDSEALAPLDAFMLYPEGDRRALWLPGWDDRSVWGFDPPDDAYFAQLWRNGSTSQGPDIWICGRGHAEGRAFVVMTTHLLAREIAAATGAGLAAVGKAMLGIEPVPEGSAATSGRLCSGTDVRDQVAIAVDEWVSAAPGSVTVRRVLISVPRKDV